MSNPNAKFCHLHVHNEFSILDGFGKAEAYAARAKEMGFEYLALTNHGNIDGSAKFQHACKDAGIKGLYGFEAYIVDDIHKKEKGEKRYHATVLAKSQTGWENIQKLLTKANLEGFYHRPRISKDMLLEHADGTVIMSACIASFLNHDKGELWLKQFSEATEVFLELMPLKLIEQNAQNERCIKLAKKYNLLTVATNDCHYILPEHSRDQEVMLAIQTHAKWNSPDRWKFDVTDLYLKSFKEMMDSFNALESSIPSNVFRDSLFNTLRVAELCKGFEIPTLAVNLPKVPGFEKIDDAVALRRLCHLGMNERVKGKVPDESIYRERYREEIEAIIAQGFSRYFLIVWELINWCKNNDIMVGPGRGSAGGCLVCYLLNITDVDPIKYNLIFARFISPARIDLPDIDMDFEDYKRDLVRKHLEDVYGKFNVAGVSTVSYMKGRSALRDVGRVFDLPVSDVDKAAKSIVSRSVGDFRNDFTIADAFDTFEDGIKFKAKHPEATKIAIDLENQARSYGQHAAAIVIASEDLREGKCCALRYGKEDNIVVNWEKYDIEQFGLMKLDVLGLNALTVLNTTRKMVKANHGVDVVFNDIPLDDPKCFEQFSLGNNVGCFQVGSLGLRRLSQQLGVDDFMMLVHLTSLHRPGTLRSGMTTEFIARKRREKDWSCAHPFITEMTKDTFGVILYQEQVMRFMFELGGLPWKTADMVRKVISKSQGVDQFMKFKSMFAEGCVERKTLDYATAEKVFDELASFGSYGFNLSHAVEYSLITYWDMWFKIYYAEEFLCASLTYGSEAKKEELVEEVLRIGIEVRPPKIGISKSSEWIMVKGVLYAPFGEIKGFGEKTTDQIVEMQMNKKKGFFVNSETQRKISSKVMETLNAIGAFEDRPVLEEETDKLNNYFQFSLSRDPARKFRKMMKLINKCVSIEHLKSVDFNAPDKHDYLYFGQMTEIRFGYRAAIKKVEKGSALGVAGSLGGVYGNFKDDTDFCMLVFGTDIYNSKKDAVEHSGGEFMLAYASNPSRASSLQCRWCWFGEDMLKAEFDKPEYIDLALAEHRRFSNPELPSCEACELKKTCQGVVTPSKGRYNMMIVTDSASTKDDERGEFLSDGSGQRLFSELRKAGLERRDFHITSAVKCAPNEHKTAKSKHIKACRKWLDEEIEKIQPFIIFAMGNTSLNYFTEEESGIMARNATTEWSEKHGAWICWSISAAAAYREENLPLFQDAVKNFSSKVKLLSGILKK